MSTKKAKHNLPGTIYKNGKRYWWKVKLPGESELKSRPLIPAGSTMATTDFNVATECAKLQFSQAIFQSEQKFVGQITTIAELSKAYLQHVDTYYIDCKGDKTLEPYKIRYAIRTFVELFGSVSVEIFGPLKLIQVREELIKQNICRKTINQRIGIIKRMFKWAVSRQLVSAIIYQSLLTVDGLKRGRSAAKESLPVKPIDEKYVYALLPYLTPVLSTIVQIQLLLNMSLMRLSSIALKMPLIYRNL